MSLQKPNLGGRCRCKRKEVLLSCCNLGDCWFSISKTIPFFGHGKSPTILSKAKTKARVQVLALFQSTVLWTLQVAAKQSQSPSGQLRLFPTAVHFRLLPGVCIWSHKAMDHMAARATWSRAPRREHLNTQVRTSPGEQERERNSLLEVMERASACTL